MKYALITGASSGIGEATAKLLAREGYSLFLTGRNEANLKRVADACRAIHQEEPHGDSRPPFHVHESSGDVAAEADCERLMRECLSHSQTIHAAILNAGIGRGTGALVDTTVAELDEVLRTNVRGVYLFLVRLMPVMRRQGHGQIVVTSSVKGIRAGPTGAIYCASKYAVEGLVASARCELKGSGVKIGTVNPAGVATPWWEDRARGGWEPGAKDISKFLTADDVAASIVMMCQQGDKSDISRIVLENV
ncbi:unnamed protein product [Vitrella brassicaformis CCMP3155]|uniref:Uncharacterized protein n=2 Tax=Vitrella brassicaformis TaxID=1169539 RepID=A0A0G4E8G4_VITBC|nr:unnamed protein product [Vitrella brassicaformis CCMP3155]|mmetsp:Transcript_23597/g.67782  ORF Transcript_23597/g.67782 Transcript_23597/m.67782 type:complete len:249 (-) Transcript_23597:188-934(-)|eukprot:CEL92039.1 unnamed protein product [Vitrella brassicaformis CCMP3155]